MRRFRLAFFDRIVLCAVLALSGAPLAWPDDDARGILERYIAQPDASLEWHAAAAGNVGTAEYVEYVLTSQTWRGIAWKHQLFILRPANMAANARQALLFVHGGRWKAQYDASGRATELPSEALLFARLAETIAAPVAVLRQVPFAPMFDRKEDALIAYTFDQYLRSGESDWPLLLPMVKSSVRAMDAVQAIVRERWDASIDAFTVAGASKRGWTSWLTAVVDPRVKAIAPMVIDVLNMQAQMDHQRATWGDVSEEIRDYAALDLPARLATERGRRLLSIVDPYSYRERLTQAKLILLSTNDRYWPLDALKLYWPGLPEPKRVLYVPNQGHGLQDIERVIGALSAVHRYSSSARSLPMLSWTSKAARSLTFAVSADTVPARVSIWSAQSPTRDFRDAHWTSSPCQPTNNGYDCAVPRAEQGYTAAFAEAAFAEGQAPPFSLSTTVCIAGPDSTETSGSC
jgi:PhoPQ-activated pathogenicity-related protein